MSEGQHLICSIVTESDIDMVLGFNTRTKKCKQYCLHLTITPNGLLEVFMLLIPTPLGFAGINTLNSKSFNTPARVSFNSKLWLLPGHFGFHVSRD